MIIENSEDEKTYKKGRKRLWLTGGLATVATIHAGHTVYQSMEKRHARKRAVREGSISKEEAQKHKTRDRTQDAASIGLAALGLKGAYSEWKEMKEGVEEHREEEERQKRHARKREARRRKMELVGISGGPHSSSAPALGTPLYDEHGRGHEMYGDGPYMSGADRGHMPPGGHPGQGPYMHGMNNTTQYFDENPYGWMSGAHYQHHDSPTHLAPGQGQGYGNGGGGGGGYPPPPVQGGTGFPPPPGTQHPPPQGR